MGGPVFTPLHIAAKSNDLAGAKLALETGMNIHMKNMGKTPVQILVQQRLKMLTSKQYASEDCQIMLAKNEELISVLLENDTTGYDCVDNIGLSNFHVACTLYDYSAVECISDSVADINQQVNADSKLWPGCTALHFAACRNIKTVKILVAKGANLLIRDAKNVTPFDICANSFNANELYSILAHVPAWKDIVFSDGKTKLIEYICSLRNPKNHKEFVNTKAISRLSVPNDSPTYPGCSILHIAVMILSGYNGYNDITIIKHIIKMNADIINTQDSHGASAAHLAFRQNKTQFLRLILSYKDKIINTVDEDKLSTLHIATATGNESVAQHLLDQHVDVDLAYKGSPIPGVKTGWTPLHVASFSPSLTNLLLQRGVDLLRTDSQGFTAIHLLFGRKDAEQVANVLFTSEQLKESVVQSCGLSHLHVAVWTKNIEAIERLLDLGSKIEATIGSINLKQFVGCRPIHIAMMHFPIHTAVIECLIRRGADVLTKRLNYPTSPLQEIIVERAENGRHCSFVLLMGRSYNAIRNAIITNKALQKRIETKIGMTKLHLACSFFNKTLIEKLLAGKIDVNARIFDSSDLWPGFTPLHILITNVSRERRGFGKLRPDRKEVIDLLLSKGANVTIADANGDTPVHIALGIGQKEIAYEIAICLVKHQTDFSINPVDSVGMSHFHVACLMKNVVVVEKFLKYASNIDINQVVNSENDKNYAGATPLLIALYIRKRKRFNIESHVRLVNILIENGADVHALDKFGYSPLHKLCSFTDGRSHLLNKILIDDTDINKQAKDGKTPIEILLSDGAPIKEIEYFVKRGAQINSYNSVSDIGYMSIVLTSEKYKKLKSTSHILKVMMNSPDIAKVDDSGRNTIHNAVTIPSSKLMSEDDYLELFEKLMQLGCDAHQKDRQGRSALHLAFKFANVEAIMALLMCGVDFNDVDATGLSPPFYATQACGKNWSKHEELYIFLTTVLSKCQLLHVEMNKQNTNLISKLISKSSDDGIRTFFDTDSFEREVKATKSLKIGQRGLTAYDFLCKTRLFGTYSSLLSTECEALNLLLKTLDKDRFSTTWLLIKMQGRKALDRINLLAPATVSLRTLMGFYLPDLCVAEVFKSLNNTDLRNLKISVITNDNFEMNVA